MHIYPIVAHWGTFQVQYAYLIDRIIANDSVQAAITVQLVLFVSSFYHTNHVNHMVSSWLIILKYQFAEQKNRLLLRRFFYFFLFKF